MKMLFTIGFHNRHATDADRLQAFVDEAVRSFAKRTKASTDVQQS